MDFPIQSKKSTACPEDVPILCGRTSVARGLCVEKTQDCRIRKKTLRAVPLPKVKNERGAHFGYTEADLGSSCYFSSDSLKLDYHVEYADGEPVPANFSCLTYNMWGLAKDEKIKTLFSMRQEILEKTIKETGADILCIQEMSAYAYDKMKDFIGTYKFASEVPFTATAKERNRSVEVYLLSKYKPSAISIYGLKGVLGYENSLMIVEYPNLVVFNLYNQAGSKYSPGQEHKWLHYSRCRFDLLKTLYDIFLTRYKKRDCIMCGDFNFDLDGSVTDWPEKVMIQKFLRSGFVDTFREVYPDASKKPGFTEDTQINFMRYNQKLIEKQARFDAVFFRSVKKSDRVKASKMVGLEARCLSKGESDWFLKNMAGSDKLEDLRRCYDGHLSIHPSDHFGVLTRFGSKGGGRRTVKAFNAV